MPVSLPDLEVSKPSRGEYLSLVALLGTLLAFNVATYNQYPEVWCDEVWFSEPAVNLVKYGSFTTSTWQLQPANTFPAVNCPLYIMAEVPWLAIFGTTVLAVRSFNYLLMAVSAFLLWQISWRFGLIKSASARLLMVLALHLGYGMSFSYRCSRPDVLALAALALMVLTFDVQHRRQRELYLFGLAAITAWIGFQVALFAGAALFGAWVLFRNAPDNDGSRITLRELFVAALGMVAGACSVLLLFAWKGVLSYFLPVVLGMLGKRYAHTGAGDHLLKALKTIPQTVPSYADDFSALVLALGLILICLLRWKQLSQSVRRVAIYCVALMVGTPILFNLVGHWAFYYSYMKFVPVMLGFFAVGSGLLGGRGSAGLEEPYVLSVAQASAPAGSGGVRAPVQAATPGGTPGEPAGEDACATLSGYEEPALWRRLSKWIWIAALVVAMLAGLPMRLALTLGCCRLAPRAEIQKIMREHIRPDDVVCSELDVFFEVKQAARNVYDTFYSSAVLWMPFAGAHDFSAEEKRRMTVLVIRPGDAERFSHDFGGQWEPLTGPFGDCQDYSGVSRWPIIGRRLANYGNQRQNERYQVQIFRRRSIQAD